MLYRYIFQLEQLVKRQPNGEGTYLRKQVMHSALDQHPQQTEIDCIKEVVQKNYESIKAKTNQIIAEELE